MSTPTTGVGWIPQDSFAARLLLARRHLGLSVKDAAARCHVHYATWSTWERGSVPQNYPEVVQQIAKGLGVDRDWLAWGGVLAATQPATGSPPADQVTSVTKRYLRDAVRYHRSDLFPERNRQYIRRSHDPLRRSPGRSWPDRPRSSRFLNGRPEFLHKIDS